MRSRYMVISSSHQTNEKGERYPDVLSFPMRRFVFRDEVESVEIDQRLKQRFYLLCFEKYGTVEFDDIVLWLNGIDSIHNVKLGTTIYLPSKRDIEKFIMKNKVKEEE